MTRAQLVLLIAELLAEPSHPENTLLEAESLLGRLEKAGVISDSVEDETDDVDPDRYCGAV